MELCTTELFINVHSKVKPSMKNKCYNVIVKIIRESEDIIAVACTCLAVSCINCLGKCNHIGAILFALEDFNRNNLKTFVEPLTCTSQLSKWNGPHYSSINSAPVDKIVVKELNLERICPQKVNQKIIVMTHLHQMINIVVMTVWTHWKETFKKVCLPVDFLYSMTLNPDVQKIVKRRNWLWSCWIWSCIWNKWWYRL